MFSWDKCIEKLYLKRNMQKVAKYHEMCCPFSFFLSFLSGYFVNLKKQNEKVVERTERKKIEAQPKFKFSDSL